ncbi:hypothetical protein P3T73_17135 [Kiritimatiellota bacterium B12222]|nr:hypothetical protein P3T73_17135 [Kiritimatiellota bacterium B12222]
MKKYLTLCFCLLFVSPLFAQKALTVVVKEYDKRAKSFPDRPYGKDDMSYGLYLDIFDGMGGWRMGASYAGDLTGPDQANMVITPEITLLGSDKLFVSGVSLMMDYIDSDTGTEWSDLYFQIQLGLNVPLGNRFQAGIHAYFPFTEIQDFGDFDTGELDYGISISCAF